MYLTNIWCHAYQRRAGGVDEPRGTSVSGGGAAIPFSPSLLEEEKSPPSQPRRLVRRRRRRLDWGPAETQGRGHPPQASSAACLPGKPPKSAATNSVRRPPIKETAVMAALRRNEEKRARDARRARLVERALEARKASGPGPSPGADRGGWVDTVVAQRVVWEALGIWPDLSEPIRDGTSSSATPAAAACPVTAATSEITQWRAPTGNSHVSLKAPWAYWSPG